MSPNPAVLTWPAPVSGGGSEPISGMSAWWKADSLTLSDNDAVATWGDSSGNGADATQSTPGYRPIYKTGIRNGLPVVRFAGTFEAKHHMSTTASASTAAVTLTTVIYLSSVYLNYATPIGSTISGGWQIDLRTLEGLRLLRQFIAEVGRTGGSTISIGAWYILTARYGSGAWKLRINGTDYTGSGSHTPTASRTFILGRNGSNDASLDNSSYHWWFGGDMCESLVYPTALSDTDIAANESYLADKWGF